MRVDPALYRRGAILAFRKNRDEKPFALLGRYGLLAGPGTPITAALDDARTVAGIQETGVLIACFDVLETALLRSLGLPATLLTGLVQPDLDGLQRLARLFGSDDPRVDPQQSSTNLASQQTGGSLADPPRLALMGWSPRSLSTEPPPLLCKLASSLGLASGGKGARRHRSKAQHMAFRLSPRAERKGDDRCADLG